MARRVLAVLLGAAAARAVTLHGSMGSRSPLCNWYLEERQIPYTMVAPRPSAHPSTRCPSSPTTAPRSSNRGDPALPRRQVRRWLRHAEDRAKHAKWVVWANAALDPICFVENDRGQVVGTKLDQPGRAVNVLDELLESSEYLVDGAFSVSDVAVASYLNYVPLFFPSVNLGNTPNVCRYMKRCAERPAFAAAFGDAHSAAVLKAVDRAAQGGDKKLFGIL
ncbi:glutathione S-transferase [Aureococcus anophagefferens]|nr:glutathione S-transferase [Aureococcus anophagefferens]